MIYRLYELRSLDTIRNFDFLFVIRNIYKNDMSMIYAGGNKFLNQVI